MSCKVAPLPRKGGEVVFEAYPEVWDGIKANVDEVGDGPECFLEVVVNSRPN